MIATFMSRICPSGGQTSSASTGWKGGAALRRGWWVHPRWNRCSGLCQTGILIYDSLWWLICEFGGWTGHNLLVLGLGIFGNDPEIHFITINNHPRNPQQPLQQPIHSLRLAPVRHQNMAFEVRQVGWLGWRPLVLFVKGVLWYTYVYIYNYSVNIW